MKIFPLDFDISSVPLCFINVGLVVVLEEKSPKNIVSIHNNFYFIFFVFYIHSLLVKMRPWEFGMFDLT